MSIKVGWDDERKLLMHYEFPRNWTWDMFYEAKAKAYDMVDSVDYPIGVMMSTPPEMSLPPNILSHLRSALANKHENTVIVVVVLQNAFLIALVNILMRIARTVNVHIVNTPEEGRSIIYRTLQKELV